MNVPNPNVPGPNDPSHLGRLWGHLLPNRSETISVPHIFDSILRGLDDYGMVMFMEAYHPTMTQYAFRQARRPGGPWEGHVQLMTPHAVIAWHHARHVALNPNAPPVPLPLPGQVVNANRNSMGCPIDLFISRGRLDILQKLEELGHWDPLGYQAGGYSYLYWAFTCNQQGIVNHIISVTLANPGFIMGQATVSEVVGIQIASNHLDLVIHNNRYQDFLNMWNVVQPQNPATALHPRTQEELCTMANNQMANQLLVQGLNLAHVLNPAIPPLFGGGGNSTAWHLAIRNRNVDFLDFLATHIPDLINTSNIPTNGPNRTPLEMALENNRLDLFLRLLHHGAEPRHAPKMLLRLFVPPRNPYLAAVWPLILNPNPGLFTLRGTLLHHAVIGYHIQKQTIQNDQTLTPAQRGARKRTLLRRAERLFPFVRRGNANGMPDPWSRNRHLRTAWQTANHLHLHEILWLLHANPQPALQRPHRYNLR